MAGQVLSFFLSLSSFFFLFLFFFFSFSFFFLFLQAIHEARSYGDRELIKLVMQHRRAQAETYLKVRSARTIEKIKELDDFYLEMRWDFSSWSKSACLPLFAL